MIDVNGKFCETLNRIFAEHVAKYFTRNLLYEELSECFLLGKANRIPRNGEF